MNVIKICFVNLCNDQLWGALNRITVFILLNTMSSQKISKWVGGRLFVGQGELFWEKMEGLSFSTLDYI